MCIEERDWDVYLSLIKLFVVILVLLDLQLPYPGQYPCTKEKVNSNCGASRTKILG